jgi:hypothetical protein
VYALHINPTKGGQSRCPTKSTTWCTYQQKKLNLPKGRARKLAPKFIGPYKVIAAAPETSTYKLALSDDLTKRKIHPTFHGALLRAHEANDETVFPSREAKSAPKFTRAVQMCKISAVPRMQPTITLAKARIFSPDTIQRRTFIKHNTRFTTSRIMDCTIQVQTLHKGPHSEILNLFQVSIHVWLSPSTPAP